MDKYNEIKLRLILRTCRFDDDDDTNKGGNRRLPYGLCKKFGVEVQKGWTPTDAWKALEGETGIGHDYVISQIADYGHTRKIKAHKPTGKYAKHINTFVTDFNNSTSGSQRFKACNKLIKQMGNGDVMEWANGTIMCETDANGWSRYFFTGYNAGSKHTAYEMSRDDATKAMKSCIESRGSASAANLEINHPDISVTRKKKYKQSETVLKGITSTDHSVSAKKGTKTTVTFGSQAYSKKNKDNAVWIWHLNPRMGEGLGLQFARDQQGAMMSKVENDTTLESAFWRYTKGSGHINLPLRGAVGWGQHCWSNDANATNSKARVNTMTSVLDQSTFKTDIWVQRGSSERNLCMLFGVSDISKLKVGDEGTEKAFTSCALARDTGFTGKGVIVNTYCPTGTKALYINNVSKYKTSKEYVENEIVLQRGTTFKITKISPPSKKNDNQWVIDLDVVGQEYTSKVR